MLPPPEVHGGHGRESPPPSVGGKENQFPVWAPGQALDAVQGAGSEESVIAAREGANGYMSTSWSVYGKNVQ